MLKDLLITLKNGGSIPLETAKDQWGEKFISRSLSFKEGQWLDWGVDCWSSSSYGLGTCQCHSHNPDSEKAISRKRALELLSDYIKKQEKDAQLRAEETTFLDSLISQL